MHVYWYRAPIAVNVGDVLQQVHVLPAFYEQFDAHNIWGAGSCKNYLL